MKGIFKNKYNGHLISGFRLGYDTPAPWFNRLKDLKKIKVKYVNHKFKLEIFDNKFEVASPYICMDRFHIYVIDGSLFYKEYIFEGNSYFGKFDKEYELLVEHLKGVKCLDKYFKVIPIGKDVVVNDFNINDN